MAKNLESRITFALDETRMLMLGVEIFLGFEFQLFFREKFDHLPAMAQFAQLIALLLTILSMVLLIAPIVFHRVVGADRQTERVILYTTEVVEWALHPLAFAVGLSLFCSVDMVASRVTAVGVGALFTFLALFFWYVGPKWARNQSLERREKTMSTTLDKRLRHVMTESRVLLPGGQALLGFQLITFYSESFSSLPRDWQWIHVASLLAISLSIIMLIAPAAFHRIADDGEMRERSYRFASAMVLWAPVPLGLGLAGDLYVVLAKTIDPLIGLVGAGLLLCLGFGLWFGYSFWARGTLHRSSPPAS